MYGGYAWLTNELPPDTDARRGAFADQGLAFGTGFLCVVAVHAGRYAQVSSSSREWVHS